MMNTKENNRIEPSERVNQFRQNGFIESSKQSNSNETNLICHCSYSHENYHEISVNLITGRYQSFNNNCLQKTNPKEFTRLYLSGYYPSNTIKTNREVTAPVNSENKSYTFNNEDKKTLEIIIKHSRFNKEVTEKLSKKRPVIYQGLNDNLPGTWGYYDKDIIDNLIKEKIIKSNVVKRIGLYSNKLNIYSVLVCNQDYSYYKAYNLDNNSENKVYNPYQIKKIIYNIEKIKPDTKKIYIFESTEKALSSEVTLNDNSIVCLGLHGIGTSLNEYLDLFQDKEVYIIFDKRADKIKNTDIERTNALKRAIELTKVTKNVFISEIPYLNKDIDIDDYLDLFPKDERKDKLNEIINSSFEIPVYKSLYQVNKVSIPLDETRRIRQKRISKRIEKKIEYETIKQIRENNIKNVGYGIINFHENKEFKALLLSSQAGTGKTTGYLISLKHIVGLGGKHLYITQNNELCKQVSEKALKEGIENYHIKSNLIYCESNHNNNINYLDDNAYYTDTNNQLKFRRVERYKIRQKNNYETKDICNSCPLKSTCENMIHRKEGYFKKEVPLYIMTLSKYKELIKSDEIKEHISNNFLSIVFDENISNIMLDKKEYQHKDIPNIIDTLEFYQINNKLNEDQLKALEVLKEMYKDKVIFNNVESKDIVKFYNVENKGLYDRLHEIKVSNLDLEYNQDIDKNNIENKDNADKKRYEHIPKSFLKDFISALKSTKNKNILFCTNKSFTILKKNKFNKDLDLFYIFLDASTDISLLSYHTGIKEHEINHYKPQIKYNNLKVYQVYSSTFSKQFFDRENNIKALSKFINSRTKDNERSLITTNKWKDKKLRDSITIDNYFLHYGNETGRNDLENYNNNFVFNPMVDETLLHVEMKVLFDIEPKYNLEYKQTSIKLDDSNYLEIENRVYKNNLLEKHNQTQRQAPMYQGACRIYRNYENPKEKSMYIFSDLDMSMYFDNIVPLELEKISKVSDERKEVTKVFKDMIIYSLSKYSIIPTESFIKTSLNKINFNDENLIKECKLVKNENSNLVIAHQVTFPYELYLIGNSDLVQYDIKNDSNTIYSIDYIMNYIKENFSLGDTTLKKIKKDVFSELSIKTYFLESSNQGIFHTDNVELANQIKEFYKGYQNTSKINDIIKDSINTPNYDLNLDIELKNDSLDNAFKSNEVQKEVFAPAGEYVTNGTFKEQKENTTMSYDDYVNTNLSDLYDYLDKFLNDKALKNELINDNDFTLLEDLLNDSTSKCLTLDCFKYEYLITDIADNLISYNQQIQELIDFNKTNSKVISLKEKYDNYVNTNKSYLDNKVNDLIHKIANKDKLIDNKLIDYLIYITKLPLDKNNIEKSLYYQFLAFNLSENIDKYNLIINKIQVDNDNKGIDKELRDTKLDNSYIDTFIDKEPDNNLTNHSSIFSLVFNDYIKDNELKLINDSILKISNINVQKNLRKYISILIINKIKLTNDYFIRLDKWVLKACDVDELIKRQQLRDFVKLCKNSLEVLIAS